MLNDELLVLSLKACQYIHDTEAERRRKRRREEDKSE